MPTANVIVDLSHHNANVDMVALKAGGILGIIHKATQGWRFIDPTYQTNRANALSAGLLWGAYHFGTSADGVAQADFFLSTVNDSSALLVLDLEANRSDSSMDPIEARAFVTHVQQETGRWPGLYAGQYLKELLGKSPDPVLSNCWLWLAQYGPTAVLPPGWSTWTLWQYTDGAVGPDPHDIPGFGRCDRDLFNGTVDELQTSFWNGAQLPASASAAAIKQVPYQAQVTAGLLNVRNGPRLWADVVDHCTLGTSVYVYQESDGWCSLDSAGTHWVSGRYLSRVYTARP